MSKLKLLELRCNESEDSGGDEAYITVEGKKVWSTENIEDGESVSLRSVKAIGFEDEVTVALWDEDSGLFDSDDNLGEFVVSEDLEGEDEQEYNFKGDGADYLLIYKVIED